MNEEAAHLFRTRDLMIVRKLPVVLHYEIADTDYTIHTKEGDVVAHKGDAILTGTRGERWPIQRGTFEQTYDFDSDGTCVKKPINVQAVELDRPLSVVVSWGSGVIHGKPGDVLVLYGQDSYGIVDREIFNERHIDVLTHACTTANSEKLYLLGGDMMTALKLPKTPKEKKLPKLPTVGDTIYVDSAFYLSHGSDDVVGGRATVTKISKDHGTVFVGVQEHPGHAYNWGLLAEKQADLKKEFGQKKARTDPDEDRPWIEEGDDVGGQPYHGPDIW